jgi:hypothetical protein
VLAVRSARLVGVDLARSTTGADRRRLWALAARVGGTAGDAFGDVGLFLEDPAGPDRDAGYDDSPAGSVLIASAGAEGVHFSALPPDGRGAAPIVMTTPLVFDRPNTVVGADLREFLALGCTSCYCCLEQLAHDVDGDWGRAAAIRRAGSARSADASHAPALVDALAREFALRPWPDVAGRLAELEREHGHRVRPAR